ncbi:MAG TPA: hypothetical protein VNO50_10825 [Pyrinomonadaceae bacterium]|nr:hypothetical protein [Pyrinomonadaceae bacterium]
MNAETVWELLCELRATRKRFEASVDLPQAVDELLERIVELVPDIGGAVDESIHGSKRHVWALAALCAITVLRDKAEATKAALEDAESLDVARLLTNCVELLDITIDAVRRLQEETERVETGLPTTSRP